MIWATKSLFNSNKSKQKTGKQQALLKASGLCFTKHPLQTREGATRRPWVGPSYLLTDQKEHQSPPTTPERGGIAAVSWDTHPPGGNTRFWSSLIPSLWLLFYRFQWFLQRTEKLSFVCWKACLILYSLASFFSWISVLFLCVQSVSQSGIFQSPAWSV